VTVAGGAGQVAGKAAIGDDDDVASREAAHLRDQIVGGDIARRDEGVGVRIHGQPIALVGSTIIWTMAGVINQEAVVFSQALAEVRDGVEDFVACCVLVEQNGYLKAIFAAQESGERFGVVDCGFEFG
jgi:hypothetical protein